MVFGGESAATSPSQKYLQQLLLPLLFQQYSASLFHGTPAVSGSRSSANTWSGNLTKTYTGGRQAGREVGWLRWRKWTLFQRFSVVLRVERSLTAYSHPQIIFSSFLSLLQLLQSLCCASLQTEARRNARARASTLRTDGRGTEKARWDFTLASVQKEISYRRCVHTGLVRENYLKRGVSENKTKIINVLVFTYRNFES